MPIKPENKHRYPPPKEWKAMRAAVLERAGNACEGSPAFPECRISNGWYRNNTTGEVTKNVWDTDTWTCVDGDSVSRIVLTIAHLEHDDLETRDLSRLRAWCNRCHLTYDAKHHAINSAMTRRKGKAVADLFESTQ